MQQQLSLFDTGLKISKIKDIIHKLGQWQNENCYITKVSIDEQKDFMIISNYHTYGDTEINHETVCLIRKDNRWKISHMHDIELMSYSIYELTKKLFEPANWEEFIIDNDLEEKEIERLQNEIQ